MKNQFKIGSTVHLNSGSPKMKIVSFVENVVRVEWRDSNGKVHLDMFPSTSLKNDPTN